MPNCLGSVYINPEFRLYDPNSGFLYFVMEKEKILETLADQDGAGNPCLL